MLSPCLPRVIELIKNERSESFLLSLPASEQTLSQRVRDNSEPRSVIFQNESTLCYTILHSYTKVEKCVKEEVLATLSRIN